MQCCLRCIYPRDIKMLGWSPVGPVLPHREKAPFLVLVGCPSSDGIRIKIPYGVDILLHQPALHPVHGPNSFVGSHIGLKKYFFDLLNCY